MPDTEGPVDQDGMDTLVDGRWVKDEVAGPLGALKLDPIAMLLKGNGAVADGGTPVDSDSMLALDGT